MLAFLYEKNDTSELTFVRHMVSVVFLVVYVSSSTFSSLVTNDTHLCH